MRWFAVGVLVLAGGLRGGDVSWSNTGGSTAWLTDANWSTGVYAKAGDVAIFNNTGSATSAGINMGTAGGSLSLQGIHMTDLRTRALTVGNSSLTVDGTLLLTGGTVNGVADVILRNNSGGNLTVQNIQGSGTRVMDVSLGNATENKVVIDGAGSVAISSVIKSNSGNTPLTVLGIGSGRVDITNTANTFTGNVSILGSEVRFSADGSLGNAANAITIDGGRFATADSATFTLGATRQVLVGDGAGTAISTPGTGVLTYNGVMTDKAGETGSWAKQGSGTLVLGGANTYNGSTTVSGGSLKVTNTTGSATGTGNVTISSSSTILGSGIVSPSNGGTVTVESGGRVAVGEVAGTTGDGAKILTFQPATGTMTTTLKTGSVLEFDLFANNGDNYATASSADLFRTGGQLVFESGVTLRVLGPTITPVSYGNVWRLLDWSTLGGSITGDYTQLVTDLPAINPGHSWDLSQFFVDGSISVVPEPSRAFLLGLGLLLLLSKRQR